MRAAKAFYYAMVLIILFGNFASAKETRLLRFPDIHADQIIFVYAGDLWRVSSQGGIAQRLTSYDGYEAFPNSRRTGNSSPSPEHTMATATSSSSPPREESLKDLLIIRGQGSRPER